MFSITKIKLHGMQDERWTTKDKLHQYRGLIHLYNRDRKIIDFDKATEAKRHVKDLKILQRKNAFERQNLDNAIRGDRQKVRNTLAEDRSLQLAYQNLHPTKIVEQIYQENFNKRKELDRILYKQTQKTNRLIALKLELAELEDRLKFEGPGKIQIEIEAGMVTEQVQHAILKKEAAITVQQTYIKIINIMKKDRIYYDAVLNSLKQDCISQGICLLHTTQMGQLATEYLDDRRQEYRQLECQVRSNMKQRLNDLDQAHEEVGFMTKNVKNLIRRDSDTIIRRHSTTNTNIDDKLNREIQFTKDMLEKLRTATLVSSFAAIYPCLVAQRNQNARLKELFERDIKDRERLLNKNNHATLMLDHITHTMVETTMEYKQEKKEILKKMREQLDRRRIIVDMIRLRSELMVNIRRSLQQLFTITTPIIVGGESRFQQLTGAKFQTDALKLVEVLARRLHVLAALPAAAIDSRNMHEADELFQKLVQCDITHQTSDLDENELLNDLVFEDALIPTRDYIKMKSKELVDHNIRQQRVDANTAITTDKSIKAYQKARSKKKTKE